MKKKKSLISWRSIFIEVTPLSWRTRLLSFVREFWNHQSSSNKSFPSNFVFQILKIPIVKNNSFWQFYQNISSFEKKDFFPKKLGKFFVAILYLHCTVRAKINIINEKKTVLYFEVKYLDHFFLFFKHGKEKYLAIISGNSMLIYYINSKKNSYSSVL